MSTKQRNENPVAGDTVQLRLFTYNNGRNDPFEMGNVDIYFLDPDARDESNPDGRSLVATIDSSDVTRVEEGEYMVEVVVSDPCYVIGQYLDVWHVTYAEYAPAKKEENRWQVYPNLWYSTPIPIVYDVTFDFRPNRIRQGSKRYLDIDVTPNVPRCSDLERYYAMLAVTQAIKISVAMNCVECLPAEEDLRLVVDKASVPLYDRGHAYYLLDTTDMPCGIYDIWFDMELGESTFISERSQLQIF